MGKNKALINHITLTLPSLLNIHKDAGVWICGDRNSVDNASFLAIDPSLRQIVNFPTHGPKTIDVVYTNLHRYYQPAINLPPLAPDNPLTAVPSDHQGVQVIPITNHGNHQLTKKSVRKIRPLPDSSIDLFNLKLGEIDFDQKFDNLPVN